MDKRLFVIAVFFSSIFLLVGTAFLHDYGQNWDESVHFFRGQAFLSYFLTGKKAYEGLPNFILYHQKDNTVFYAPEDQDKKKIPRVSMYQYKRLAFNYWKDTSPGHPPLSDIFASFFNFVLFQKLGFINDVDSYHVYSIFLASILIGTIFIWISRNYGVFAGLVSAISLALYPIFYGESHFNIKDVPEAVFFSMSIISFYEGIVKKKNIWILLSSIFCAFAFGTKFNIVFMPFIIVPWLVIYFLGLKEKKKKYFSLIPSITIYPLIIGIIFFACWPYLWTSPWNHFRQVITYYNDIGNNLSFDSRYITYFGINTYPLLWALYVTPLVTLFFGGIGIIYSLKLGLKEKNKTAILILIWFLIPILRVSRPESGIYGGVRHIMEYVPALAILSGIGAYWLRQFVLNFFTKRKILFVLVKKRINLNLIISFLFILSFLPLTLKLISLHPNEGLFFNSLIGGFKGAREKKLLDAGMDLGNAYKLALKWINLNTEKNATIALYSGLGSDLPGIQLRGDIFFYNGARSGLERKGEYVIGLVENFDSYPDNFMYDYYNNFLTPVYEIKVEGVPIIKIWKNDKAHTKKKYLDETIIKGYSIKSSEGSLEIDFKKIVYLTKIKITFTDKNCNKSPDGSIEIASKPDDWFTFDNDLILDGLTTKYYSYKTNGEYVYPFAATDTRFIRFNYVSPNSCFKYIDGIEVHGLNGL